MRMKAQELYHVESRQMVVQWTLRANALLCNIFRT